MIDALAAVMLMGPAEEQPVNPAPSLVQVYRGKAKIRKGQSGPAVETIQKQLNGVGIESPNDGLFDGDTLDAWNYYQEKFNWWPTKAVGKNQARYLRKIYGNGQLPKECLTKGVVLCTDKTQLVLRFMKNGKQRAVGDVRFGAEQTPTRNGTFKVFRKKWDDFSVLSRTPMPYALYFSGGQAIHFSPGFRRDGYNGASLGCVNLRNRKFAKKIYRKSPLGTKVYVYRS